jgi:hypothetical protein
LRVVAAGSIPGAALVFNGYYAGEGGGLSTGQGECAMTAEEALALEVGSVAQTRVGKGWVDVEVLRVLGIAIADRPAARLTVRRLGRTKAGWRPPSFRRLNRDVRRPAGYDHATANVFADWLSDRGEEHAADLLREAFPLGPG